jgi:phage shock protein PspC (stress-responsive transcriptional regulator)
MTTTNANPNSDSTQAQRTPLNRPASGRMLTGVAAGIARYTGTDPALVRTGLAALTVVSGVGIPIYLAGALLIPDEQTHQSAASSLLASLRSPRHA